jgi:methylated-DNA-[protein]-cysteine S-methyltransferase
LIKIPYGKTASYSDIAERIGNPTAVRAVGLANRNNPIAIVVPCHRVIGKAGELRGYFYGLDT